MEPRNALAASRAWLLLSGGIDSTACLALLLGRGFSVECLHATYGQLAAEQEAAAAKRVAHHYAVPLRLLHWSGLADLANGEITGRNALLLVGALMEIGRGTGVVVVGVHAGTPYFDCSPQFLSLAQSLFDGYRGGEIRICAPFMSWSKPEILAFCEERGVPLDITYSCEVGRSSPCGACLSCRARSK